MTALNAMASRSRSRSRSSPLASRSNLLLLVFAVGWMFRPIRELWVVPRFGHMTGMLLEAPIMLVAMIISARLVIRRFEVPRTLRPTISMDLAAVGIR